MSILIKGMALVKLGTDLMGNTINEYPWDTSGGMPIKKKHTMVREANKEAVDEFHDNWNKEINMDEMKLRAELKAFKDDTQNKLDDHMAAIARRLK